MVTEVLYKESMYWISQFQTFRNESELIKKSLMHSEFDRDSIEKAKIKKVLQYIVAFNKSLDETEEIILASINNGTNYWPNRCNSCDSINKAKSTDDIFDRVKSNYNDFIELQRAASSLFLHSYINSGGSF